MLDAIFGPRRKASLPDALDDFWYSGAAAGRRTRAGVVVDEDIALTYAAVWRATRILSEATAGLPLLLYRRLANGDRELATDHPMFDLAKSMPNPSMGSMAFREGRTVHQINWGNGFAEIERDGRGRISALWPIHPNRVQPVGANDADQRGVRLIDAGYAYKVRSEDGTWVAMKPEEVLHIPGAISEDGCWGKGVVAHARESVGFGIGTERHGANQFGSGNLPKVVVMASGLKDKDARRNFREEWREIHGHPDSAEVAILPTESKLEKLNFSNEDSQYLGTRAFNKSVIADWYGLPGHMLGTNERPTYASVEVQSIEFVIFSLMPWPKRWEEQLALKLLTPAERREYYFEHSFGGLLRGDIASRMTAYQVALVNGIMTLNEVRRLENLPGIGPAGDEHYVAMNLTTAQRMMEGPPEPATTDPGKAASLFDAWTRRLLGATNHERRRILNGANGDGSLSALLYSPGQKRDKRGRWTSGGGGDAGGSPEKKSKAAAAQKVAAAKAKAQSARKEHAAAKRQAAKASRAVKSAEVKANKAWNRVETAKDRVAKAKGKTAKDKVRFKVAREQAKLKTANKELSAAKRAAGKAKTREEEAKKKLDVAQARVEPAKGGKTKIARPGEHKTLEDATAWATAHGVHVHSASPKPVTLDDLNAVNAEIAKMPPKALKAIKDAGSRMDLVANGGITSHPDAVHLKGVTPRGWEGTGRTWDTVPGGGASDKGGATIIVANKLRGAHGSANLVLHEHAHTLDAAIGSNGPHTSSAAWKAIHSSHQWPTAYQRNHPEEAFAESFAKYYHGKDTRAYVPMAVREFFRERFG